jgi:hypothetical protein
MLPLSVHLRIFVSISRLAHFLALTRLYFLYRAGYFCVIVVVPGAKTLAQQRWHSNALARRGEHFARQGLGGLPKAWAAHCACFWLWRLELGVARALDASGATGGTTGDTTAVPRGAVPRGSGAAERREDRRVATSTSDARLVSSDIEHRSAWGPANQREPRAFLLAWVVLCSVRLC